MKRILTLVITDYYIGGLIKAIQKILSDDLINSPPHITIRGPYDEKTKISKSVINKINDTLSYLKGIEINGIGNFYIDENYSFTFFKVVGDELRDITWKKEFPIYKYGFNPHITLCKTSDFEKVDKIIKLFEYNSLQLFIPKNSIEIKSYTIGKTNEELDFYNYATFDELVEYSDYYKNILHLCNEVSNHKIQYNLFDEDTV